MTASRDDFDAFNFSEKNDATRIGAKTSQWGTRFYSTD